MMATGRRIDVDQIVDEQRLKPFNYWLLILSFLILTVDGYDISALPAAGPSLIKAFGLTSMGQLTPAFSANNFGVLLGAPCFGFIGDRWGRKPAIILSVLVFGLLTLCAPFAGNVGELTVIRLVTGFGVGGVMANTIALTAEMAPARVRATFIILMFMGNTFGGAIPPVVSATLVPLYGWQVIFWIGGVVPLVMAAALVFILPESIKFLALSETRRTRAASLLRRLQPGLILQPGDSLMASETKTTQKARLADLFRGRFALITPLLWLMFCMNLMVFYFINTWMQTLLGHALAPAGDAAKTAAIAVFWFQIGGTLTGLALCRLVDKGGLKPVIGAIALAIPTTGALGYAAPTALLPWLAFLSGFAILGVQAGINAVSGMIYPTAIRSKGVGMAFGIGRLGAVLGPIIGGVLTGLGTTVDQLFVFATAPMLVSLVACLALIRLLGPGGVSQIDPTPALRATLPAMH